MRGVLLFSSIGTCPPSPRRAPGSEVEAEEAGDAHAEPGAEPPNPDPRPLASAAAGTGTEPAPPAPRVALPVPASKRWRGDPDGGAQALTMGGAATTAGGGGSSGTGRGSLAVGPRDVLAMPARSCLIVWFL